MKPFLCAIFLLGLAIAAEAQGFKPCRNDDDCAEREYCRDYSPIKLPPNCEHLPFVCDLGDGNSCPPGYYCKKPPSGDLMPGCAESKGEIPCTSDGECDQGEYCKDWRPFFRPNSCDPLTLCRRNTDCEPLSFCSISTGSQEGTCELLPCQRSIDRADGYVCAQIDKMCSRRSRVEFLVPPGPCHQDTDCPDKRYRCNSEDPRQFAKQTLIAKYKVNIVLYWKGIPRETVCLHAKVVPTVPTITLVRVDVASKDLDKDETSRTT
ncbi:hypothetical protein DdX_09203 [Ditylenchus destructor]|uniref:Uncharacterized protein n=1 Tax=Ditylenchus destructor TaxID=166010 RepID=A0AAD4N343_9BILA|nr:hypothetical protein DdX_09203 [Ditylenchus destructor]